MRASKTFLVAAIVAVILLPIIAFAYTSPGQPTGFVNDFASMFSAVQKTALESKLSEFQKQSTNEIAVVTIKSLGGDTIENYAVKLFAEWGIGKKGKDNGALLLIALDDRQMRIEVGYGLEPYLTDAESFHIIHDILTPAFQKSNFYDGVNQAVDRMEAVTSGEVAPASKTADASSWLSFVNPRILFIFFGLLIYFGSLLARSKSWWAGGVVGGIFGIIIGFLTTFVYTGIIALAVLIPLGLLFDYLVSKTYAKHKSAGTPIPWWIGGGSGSGYGGGGFGGFGGGGSGGGGSSGGW